MKHCLFEKDEGHTLKPVLQASIILHSTRVRKVKTQNYLFVVTQQFFCWDYFFTLHDEELN